MRGHHDRLAFHIRQGVEGHADGRIGHRLVLVGHRRRCSRCDRQGGRGEAKAGVGMVFLESESDGAYIGGTIASNDACGL